MKYILGLLLLCGCTTHRVRVTPPAPPAPPGFTAWLTPAASVTGDMQISGPYDPGDGTPKLVIASGIQLANNRLDFCAQSGVGAPRQVIGTWAPVPQNQRVGIGVEVGGDVRWIFTVNTPESGFAPAAAMPALVDTGWKSTNGVAVLKIFRVGKSRMFVLKP